MLNTTSQMPSLNIFDELPVLSAVKVDKLHDKLDRYLSTDPEYVKNVLLWWVEWKHIYPHLSRMAQDYLTIPGVFPNIFCVTGVA
jgi:hypothetical protein